MNLKPSKVELHGIKPPPKTSRPPAPPSQNKTSDGAIVDLLPYEVYEYAWGTAIKKRNGKWEKLFLRNNSQEINVENINLILHENGIEFV